MKTLKFPAFVLAFVIAITGAFAFNTKPVESGKFSKVYFYTGDNTLAQIQNPSKWILNGDPCGTGSNLPCTKNFVSDVRADFDAHIMAYASVAAATADASTKRP